MFNFIIWSTLEQMVLLKNMVKKNMVKIHRVHRVEPTCSHLGYESLTVMLLTSDVYLEGDN